jgi:hypothetical protein
MNPGTREQFLHPSGSALFLSTRRKALMRASDQSVKLAKVRFLSLAPSRQPSRNDTAGRESQFGTVSTCMRRSTPIAVRSQVIAREHVDERDQLARFQTNGLPKKS